MFRSIMVPLDGSRFAEHALPTAIGIARPAGANLGLVRVHESRTSARESEIAMDRFDKIIQEREQNYLNETAESASTELTTPVAARLLSGTVVDSLSEYAAQSSCDLVVMTTHGRGPLSRFWLGSVADKLIRRLPIPVLLVRPEDRDVDLSRERGFRRILIPLDGSSFSERILETAIALGTLVQAEYTLLRVVTPITPLGEERHGSLAAELGLGPSMLDQVHAIPENERRDAQEYLEQVAVRMRAQGHSVQVEVISHWNHATAILERISDGVDLVALATHGRGGLARLMLGSVADKIIRSASVPVLIHSASDD